MPSPRRVLFIDHTAQLGGGEVALLNLIAALDRTRDEPVVVLFGHGPLIDKLAAIGIEATVLRLDPKIAEVRKDALGTLRAGPAMAMTLLRFVWTVRRFIRRSNIDLVHTNSLKADLIGGLAARLARRPVVWHVRDRIAEDYLPARAVKLFRAMARRVPTGVIANSRATLDTMNPAGDPPRIGKKRAWVVHDGTCITPLPPPVMREDDCVIGLVGRLAPWKGQHIFIEAAARVRARFPEVRFQIIGAALFGENDYERSLHASVEALGLGEVIEFTGFRPDVDVAIANLDILLHASTTGEPVGQVIIEGMVAGKPVIATRGGGVPDIVVDGETGVLVPMGDAAAMAVAMERLLADPDLRQSMGTAGRRRVEEHFTMAHVAANLQDVFDQIVPPK